MRRRGYRCFKLKILGKDNAADAARTVEVYRALKRFGVELNSPQYMPDANTEWLTRLSALFEPREGVHRIEQPKVVGLGSRI